MKWILSTFLIISSLCFSIDKLPHCESQKALEYIKELLPDDPIIIECGAFDGYETVLMAMTWPSSIIHTFEPVPDLFNKVKTNTSLYHNVKAYELALGDFCGKSIFYLSHVDGILFGASSALPPTTNIHDIIKFNHSIQVNMVTLDKWAKMYGVDKIDFMWLDMQGYELNMLKKSKIAKKAKVIYIEVEFVHLYKGQYLYEDILKWMDKNDFEMIANDFTEKNPHFGNAVFVNKKR